MQNSSKVSSEAHSLKLSNIHSESAQDKAECETVDINSIRAVCFSKMGLRNYDDMENQDFGIFDGHGEYGKVIADAAKTIFQSNSAAI
jgi:hypothetical protein